MSASAPEPTTAPVAAPSRRTVLRTAAWAAPAITLATAAPAFASSHVNDFVNLSVSATLDKAPGKTWTNVYLNVTNDGPDAATGLGFALTGPGALTAVTAPAGWTWSATAGEFSYGGSVPKGTHKFGPFSFKSGNASGTATATLRSGSFTTASCPVTVTLI